MKCLLNWEKKQKKKTEKVQINRCISSMLYQILHQFIQEVNQEHLSFTSFINLKPFYVSPPTTKEMEICLCSKCLNLHSLYKAIKNESDELPYCLSDFLCKIIKCARDHGKNFFELKSLMGTCKNDFNITDIAKDLTVNDDSLKKLTSYYNF